MARRPSQRRNFKEEEENDLNLTPLMNVISILIPLLLFSLRFVQIAALEFSAPQMNNVKNTQQEKKEVALNLTLAITNAGYKLKGSSEIVPGLKEGITIPLLSTQVECRRYLDTAPPPRAVNTGKCKDATQKMSFQVFNNLELNKKLKEVKDAHTDESTIGIEISNEMEMEALIDAKDAARSYGGDVKTYGIYGKEGTEKIDLFRNTLIKPNQIK